MKVKTLLTAGKAFVKANGPWLAVGFGLAAAFVAGVRAVQKTPEAVKNIEEKKEEKGEDLTVVETVKATWQCYLPSLIIFVLACCLIIGGQKATARRAAAFATAYSLSEEALKEYRTAAKEVLGEKKEAEVHAKAAENSVKKDPPPPGFVMVGGKGNQLCKDEFSGHYFWSNSEHIWRVMNEITHQCGYSDFVYLNEYYYQAGVYDGLECKYAKELGWPQNTKLEPEFSCALGSGEYENIPVLVVGFNKRPDHPKDSWGNYL